MASEVNLTRLAICANPAEFCFHQAALLLEKPNPLNKIDPQNERLNFKATMQFNFSVNELESINDDNDKTNLSVNVLSLAGNNG